MAKRKTRVEIYREAAINKAVGVLTQGNPIDIFLLGKLSDKLDTLELADIGVIIASDYSPEGAMTWQDFLNDQAA